MPKKKTNFKKIAVIGLPIILVITALAGVWLYNNAKNKAYNATTFAMDTIITQTVYGPSANAAMREVNVALAEYEKRLSLFTKEGDIFRINQSAGEAGVEVSPETAQLLRQSVQLSAQSEGAFAISIAPLTTAWGITTDTPRQVPQEEIDALLPLVNDSLLTIEGDTVTLPEKGMGIDLGGIAKGAACSLVQDIYEKHSIQSGILSIGGNIYVHGKKPDGSDFRVGFRNPNQDENSYIASFTMPDKVMAVSGGYERFFELDGQKYIHIIDPRTGKPAQSDILSVGAVDQDGAVADFYSTTLFIWGKERALEYMKNGGCAILLDTENNLYVSESLREGFALREDAEGLYTVIFI